MPGGPAQLLLLSYAQRLIFLEFIFLMNSNNTDGEGNGADKNNRKDNGDDEDDGDKPAIK